MKMKVSKKCISATNSIVWGKVKELGCQLFIVSLAKCDVCTLQMFCP